MFDMAYGGCEPKLINFGVVMTDLGKSKKGQKRRKRKGVESSKNNFPTFTLWTRWLLLGGVMLGLSRGPLYMYIIEWWHNTKARTTWKREYTWQMQPWAVRGEMELKGNSRLAREENFYIPCGL